MALRSLANDLFQPTPSARRVTKYRGVFPLCFLISTHTLRKEGDIIKYM